MAFPPTPLVLLVVAAGLAAAGFYVWRAAAPGGDHKIRVVGVGGGGSNAVDAMIRARLRGVDYLVVNTDARALRHSSASTKLAIGRQITNGLGTGGDPRAGEVAARDATDDIGKALNGSDFVVVIAGLGGGAGSGAAPVIAEIARQKGALTMAVVTTPFTFEGTRRHAMAEQAAATLATRVDAVATVPNDQVRDELPAGATVEDAFRAIDEALSRTVGEILDLVTGRGRMNLDFADVRAVLQGGGSAAVGIGRAAGENRARDAAAAAVAAALPAGSKASPKSVLVNLAGSNKLRLAEVDAVTDAVMASAGRDANLTFGMNVRPQLRDEVQVTVIATGTAPRGQKAPATARSTESVETDASGPEEAEADLPEVADAAIDPEAQPAPWQPVWLRRAPADRRSGAFGQRKTGSKAKGSAEPATETGDDPT